MDRGEGGSGCLANEKPQNGHVGAAGLKVIFCTSISCFLRSSLENSDSALSRRLRNTYVCLWGRSALRALSRDPRDAAAGTRVEPPRGVLVGSLALAAAKKSAARKKVTVAVTSAAPVLPLDTTF